jgi:F-type H+-transporting ATPase subunit delta
VRPGSAKPLSVEGENAVADAQNIVSGMAGRYASALFSIAKETKAIDAVATDLRRFVALVDANPDLQRLIKSPIFGAEDQTRALGKVLEAIGIGGLAAKFLQLVASKRRLFSVRSMIEGFHALDDADRGLSRAKVTVALALRDDQLETLRETLRSVTGRKSIELDVQVDPSIIGGIVVRLGSRMVDASLKSKLNSIRTRMKEVG